MTQQMSSMTWGRMSVTQQPGASPIVVFLHGSCCDGLDWQPVIAALPNDQAWLAMDFRGHGESDAPGQPFTLDELASDVCTLIDLQCAGPVVLVGHSLGGMVALQAAPRLEQLEAMVLLEGWTRLAVTPFAWLPDRFYGRLPAEAREQIGLKRTRTLARFDAAAWASFWKSVEAADGTACLQEPPCPIYEVYGSLGRHEGTEAALEVPDHPLIHWRWIENAGHYLPLEDPSAVAAICMEAVRQAR